MNNKKQTLKIGDKIGFTFLASDIDDQDKTLFFPVCDVTTRDGERAYIVEYPDGTRSRSAIRQSDLEFRAVQIEPVGVPNMLCLSDRKPEFRKALERGETSDLEVFPDWERDAFVVVNHGNDHEYRVNLQAHDGKLYGECFCKDYEIRKRLCKHIGAVLIDSIFTVKF